MPLRTTRFASLFLPCSLWAAGCTGQGRPEATIFRVGDGVADLFNGHENAKDQVLVLQAGGIVGVDVESFNGDVTIIEVPRATEIVITVNREARHGFERSAEATSSLEKVTASAEIVPGTLGPVLRVRASSSDPETHFQRAHVLIEGPSFEDVRVRTDHGRIEVRGASGNVDVETREGDVRVMADEMVGPSITLVARDGDIDYRARGGRGADFDLETIGGVVRVRCTEGGWTSHLSGSPSRTLARLDEGGSTVIARTVDGDIRVSIIPNPTAVGAFIVDP